MFNNSLFANWWSANKDKPSQERHKHFSSLPLQKQSAILKSFVEEKWIEYFYMNELDKISDQIKNQYNIDLLALRINVQNNKTYYKIRKSVWDTIEKKIRYYDGYCNTDLYLGGIKIVNPHNCDYYVITGV